MAAPQQPKKKSKTGLILLGCGALLLVGLLGGGGIVYYLYSEANSAADEFKRQLEATNPTTAPATGSGSGGGTCAKAAACCEKIASKSGAPGAAQGCATLKQVNNEAACQQALTGYQQSAKALSISCD